MIEELYEMYVNAKGEAACRLDLLDFRGYTEAMAFAFKCKKFAADIMNRPVVGFDFEGLPAGI